MNKHTTPKINAGSMADIAFLLLVFFLITTTIDAEMGMIRKLPEIKTGAPIHALDRNVLNIYINSENILMVQGKVRDISELKALAKAFIENKNNRTDMPVKVPINLPYLGTIAVSKQIISLQSDNETSYQTYIEVQNSLASAYHELRDELAQREFNMSYEALIKKGKLTQAKAVKRVFESNISEAEPMSTR